MSERDRPINASKELISNKIKRKSTKENFIHILDAFEILGVQIADLNARISALEDEHFIKRKKTIVHQNVNGVVQYDANDVRYSKSLAKSLDDLREYFQHVGFRLVREDPELGTLLVRKNNFVENMVDSKVAKKPRAVLWE